MNVWKNQIYMNFESNILTHRHRTLVSLKQIFVKYTKSAYKTLPLARNRFCRENQGPPYKYEMNGYQDRLLIWLLFN